MLGYSNQIANWRMIAFYEKLYNLQLKSEIDVGESGTRTKDHCQIFCTFDLRAWEFQAVFFPKCNFKVLDVDKIYFFSRQGQSKELRPTTDHRPGLFDIWLKEFIR